MLGKLFYLVSAFMVVGLICPLAAQEVDMEIGIAAQPPVIDGQVDEIWADASTQYFVPLADPANASGIWKVLYDAENLYVLVDVTDDSLHNDSAGSWQDDSVEIYFDGGNTKVNTPLSGDDHQYTFGWTTDEIQGTNITGYTDGIEQAQVTTDTGWRVEVKMPWMSIWGVVPQGGDLIGIDCYYNDDDNGGDSREGKMLSFSAIEGWNDASQWGTAILAAIPEPILVDPNSDIAAAAAAVQPGGTIEFAAGTYYLTSRIEIQSGVTYRGAGTGLTIIDGNDTTRAFVAWGDRFFNEDNENANDSGPKGWVLEGMTIQNCVADANDRFSYTGAAFAMKTNFVTLDVNESGGLDPNEANGQVGGIRLAGADGTEGTEDDDLHRFAHIDTDASGEISEAELDAQLLLKEDEFGDQAGDGGAITIDNGAIGTIQNCEFLNNHTPAAGDGDDGGAVNITGLSVITINDCLFDGNYAVSKDSVNVDGSDGDGGHIKVQGNSASALTPGTTLIANRCTFLNGNASDDGGAIQSSSVGNVIRLDSCRFEANTSWDNGNVLQFSSKAQNEATVTNCIFANNVTKADNGPDRMIETNRNSKFINCTFTGNNQNDEDMIYNNADVADTDANGVDDELADVTQVINCIFANNVVGNGDDVLGSRDDNFTIAATNCLFFGNTLQNGKVADNTQRPAVETGSITGDPLLDANYVPGAGSPAIDAGIDPVIVGITLMTDYIGVARPQGAAFDIGAFEVVAAPPAE